jgi:hypothetical protein
MKLALLFLVIVVSLVRESNEAVHAHAEMFLAGTNDFIGTINFYVEEVAWGVVITGSVNRLRPNALLVRQLLQFTLPIFCRRNIQHELIKIPPKWKNCFRFSQ